jgi:hypothetical protein
MRARGIVQAVRIVGPRLVVRVLAQLPLLLFEHPGAEAADLDESRPGAMPIGCSESSPGTSSLFR